MFGKSKDGNEPMLPQVKQPQMRQPAEQAPTNDQVSAISRGVTVVGRIFGEGTVKVFGRIEGELSATTISIQEGAQVDGDLIAEDLVIAGQVKGTILANRVKLDSTASVEGDIFHRTLSIAENAHFEGSSKRHDKAVELADSKAPAAQGRAEEAVDLPRIPLRAPAAHNGAKAKSNGHLAVADSPSLVPYEDAQLAETA